MNSPLSVVILSLLVSVTSPCLSTQPSTTTPAPTCTGCTAGQLDLSAPPNQGELVGQETLFVLGQPTAAGCTTATLECQGDANNVPIMEVNDGIGTNPPEGNSVFFDVVCTADNTWESQQAPVMTINSAQCWVTAL